MRLGEIQILEHRGIFCGQQAALVKAVGGMLCYVYSSQNDSRFPLVFEAGTAPFPYSETPNLHSLSIGKLPEHFI